MGTSLSKELALNYFAKSTQHSVFGDIFIYTPRDPLDNICYFSKPCKPVYRPTHPNLLKSYKREDQVSCSTNTTLTVWEYPGTNTLQDEIKKQNNQPFNESYIWNVLIQVIQCMVKLNEYHVYHGDLRPATIFVIDDNKIKIADCEMLQLKTSLQRSQMGDAVLLSPQQYQHLHELTDFSLFKSDVYTLGLTLGQMMILQEIQQPNLLELQIGTRYSRCLISLYQTLITHSESERPNFHQIYDCLAPYVSEIRRNNPFYQDIELVSKAGKLSIQKINFQFNLRVHSQSPEQIRTYQAHSQPISAQKPVISHQVMNSLQQLSIRNNQIRQSSPDQEIVNRQKPQISQHIYQQIYQPQQNSQNLKQYQPTIPNRQQQQQSAQKSQASFNQLRQYSPEVKQHSPEVKRISPSNQHIQHQFFQQPTINMKQNKLYTNLNDLTKSLSNVKSTSIQPPIMKQTKNSIIQQYNLLQQHPSQIDPQQKQQQSTHMMTSSYQNSNHIHHSYKLSLHQKKSNTEADVNKITQKSVKQTTPHEKQTPYKADHNLIETTKKQPSYFPSNRRNSRSISTTMNLETPEPRTQRTGSLHQKNMSEPQIDESSSFNERISNAIKLTKDLIT